MPLNALLPLVRSPVKINIRSSVPPTLVRVRAVGSVRMLRRVAVTLVADASNATRMAVANSTKSLPLVDVTLVTVLVDN